MLIYCCKKLGLMIWYYDDGFTKSLNCAKKMCPINNRTSYIYELFVKCHSKTTYKIRSNYKASYGDWEIE